MRDGETVINNLPEDKAQELIQSISRGRSPVAGQLQRRLQDNRETEIMLDDILREGEALIDGLSDAEASAVMQDLRQSKSPVAGAIKRKVLGCASSSSFELRRDTNSSFAGNTDSADVRQWEEQRGADLLGKGDAECSVAEEDAGLTDAQLEVQSGQDSGVEASRVFYVGKEEGSAELLRVETPADAQIATPQRARETPEASRTDSGALVTAERVPRDDTGALTDEVVASSQTAAVDSERSLNQGGSLEMHARMLDRGAGGGGW